MNQLANTVAALCDVNWLVNPFRARRISYNCILEFLVGGIH